MEELLKEENVGLTKKELLGLQRERDKLDRALGGIKEMAGLPDIIVVIDTNKESIAIQEARKLSIPTIAILDSNSDPEGITTPVPGNDDAMRAIALYCNLLADAVLDGLQAGLIGSGSEKEIIPEAVESEPQINKDSELRKEDETKTELVVDQETEVAEQTPDVKPENAKSDALAAPEDKEENQSSSSEVGQGQ